MAGCSRFPFAVLVDLARRGDDHAFSELVARVSTRLERIAFRIAGNPRLDAEDILQESLVHAFRSIGDLRVATEEGFLAWVAGIVRNRIGHAVRRDRPLTKPRRRTPLPWSLQQDLDPLTLDLLTEAPATESLVRERRPEEGEEDEDFESQVAAVLREGFHAPWTTLGLILGRRNPGGMRRILSGFRDGPKLA